MARCDRLAYERDLWLRGVHHVAGVDEAGRGPLAGPVAAAAVILPPHWAQMGLPPELEGLNDSKQLTAKQREVYHAFIVRCPEIRHAVVQVDAARIDAINILQATHEAMNAALARLRPAAKHAMVDGLHVKRLRVPQTALVGGDTLSYSIAAASVVAKVTRDRLMVEYHEQWPGYGFADHKGYGTEQHLEAIAKLGPCPIHRKSFSPFRPQELELFPD